MNELTSKINLLLIEDDEADIILINEKLKKDQNFDFQIDHISELSLLQNKLDKENYDLILCDLNLNDTSATTTLSRLAPFTQTYPIIVISGMEDFTLYEKASSYGFSDFLYKDQIDYDQLGKKVFFSLTRHKSDSIKRYEDEITLLKDISSEASHRFNNYLQIIYHLITKHLSQSKTKLSDEIEAKLFNTITEMGSISDQLLSISKQQELRLKEISITKILNKVLYKYNYPVLNHSDNYMAYADESLMTSAFEALISCHHINGPETSPQLTIQKIQFTEAPNQLLQSNNHAENFLKISLNLLQPLEQSKDQKLVNFNRLLFKGVIEQHKGYIDHDLFHNKLITLYIPIQKHHKAQPKPTSSTQIKTIYIVDDEDDIRELLQEFLQIQGYQCKIFGSPLEALEAIREEKPDLLITDFQMPKMTGKELFNQSLQTHHNLKCLFISGYSQSEISENGQLEEGCYFLKKPFMVSDLYEMISSL
jgi:DNA-binding response OmpR family regulator